MNQSLPKSEILRSKKIIQELFRKSSSSLYLYPFQIRFQKKNTETVDSSFPHVLFVVSKRYFKKAVDRNLIRRRIKEAYRLNKEPLQNNLHTLSSLAIMYIAKEPLDFAPIQKKLIKIINMLD
jgi:ribonuclease P protein component